MNLSKHRNSTLDRPAGRTCVKRTRLVRVMAQQQVNKGFSVLEWTSKLVPQGALVTGERTAANQSSSACKPEVA